MRTAIEFGPKVWADARDYDSWCQIGMVGSFAHNGYFGLGREEDWACHAIEHEISGWNEAITHGMGLSVVIPAWMRYVSERTPARLAQFARNVFGIVEADDAEAAKKGIEALVAFYKSLGMPPGSATDPAALTPPPRRQGPEASKKIKKPAVSVTAGE